MNSVPFSIELLGYIATFLVAVSFYVNQWLVYALSMR